MQRRESVRVAFSAAGFIKKLDAQEAEIYRTHAAGSVQRAAFDRLRASARRIAEIEEQFPDPATMTQAALRESAELIADLPNVLLQLQEAGVLRF